MPRNAKNPENPYAKAIDDINVCGMRIILDYVMLKGGASGLRFLSIGKIPGLLEVIHYIHHELSVEHKCENVFEYFQLDGADIDLTTPPPTPRPGKARGADPAAPSESMQSALAGGSPWDHDSPALDETQSPDSVHEFDVAHAPGTGISPWHEFLSPPQTVAPDHDDAPGETPWSPGPMVADAAWTTPAAALIHCACTTPENML